MSRVNQLPEIINVDDEGHIEDHEVIHEALKNQDASISDVQLSVADIQSAVSSKADVEHTHNWGQISGKPTSFTPSSHSHSASEINSGVFNIARIPVGTTATTVAAGNDSRLSNARTPTAHTHAMSDITGLTVELETKAALNHEHAISDITGLQAALNSKSGTEHTHTISQVSGLGTAMSAKADLVGGVVPTSQIPAVALTKPFPVANRAAMLALTAQEGDLAIITGTADKGSYILGDGPSNQFSSWYLLSSPGGEVQSVNGQIGSVVLGYADVGAAPASHSHSIGNISGLQSALDSKAATSHTHTAENITNSTTIGRALMTASTEASARSAIGAGTSNLTIGTTSSTAKAGDYQPTWAQVSGKPTTFTPATHTHPDSDLTATGTASSSTYLRGEGSWATPPNTTYPDIAQADAENGVSTVGRLITGQRLRQGANAAISAREWTGTQAQYDALATKDPNVTYYVVES